MHATTSDLPVSYTPNWVSDPIKVFEELLNLDWEQRDAPRAEYYCSDLLMPYTYGSGRGTRTYESRPKPTCVGAMQAQLKALTGFDFEVCFLNRYDTAHHQLGWHSDNSPEMDDLRPIAVVSLGAERELWVRPNPVSLQPPPPIKKFLLGNGSLFLMAPGMQDTHQHRIPKADREVGCRASLTFRGYVAPTL